ncbi:hypothetical protein ACFQ22_05025 [Lentilactobacillus raoultii]|uniref:Uncharacterized protein n=1 Tax=Lentilactobacillus raoultii TaxID=1987503 RepID=A0ABW3PMY2_9LACO|nr:hypothetical protein [Lentilactobacillus raoultii]
MNHPKKHGNFLFLLLIIIIVDALFIGYSMLQKHHQEGQPIQTSLSLNYDFLKKSGQPAQSLITHSF